MKNLILCFLAVAIFGMATASPIGESDWAKRVHLSEVKEIELFDGFYTAGRRSPGVEQLKCLGEYASRRDLHPTRVKCVQIGMKGMDANWKCEAELSEQVEFGELEVVCEGYESPEDPFILAGSCGLEYTLKKKVWEEVLCDGSSPYCPTPGFGVRTVEKAQRPPEYDTNAVHKKPGPKHVDRSRVGLCEPGSFCTGLSTEVPPAHKETVFPEVQICTNSTGPCSADSTCDGTTAECPPKPIHSAVREPTPTRRAQRQREETEEISGPIAWLMCFVFSLGALLVLGLFCVVIFGCMGGAFGEIGESPITERERSVTQQNHRCRSSKYHNCVSRRMQEASAPPMPVSTRGAYKREPTGQKKPVRKRKVVQKAVATTCRRKPEPRPEEEEFSWWSSSSTISSSAPATTRRREEPSSTVSRATITSTAAATTRLRQNPSPSSEKVTSSSGAAITRRR